jgi:PGF-CTERM protein
VKKKMKKATLKFLAIFASLAILVSMSATASEADVTVTSVTVSPESVEIGENVTITAAVENTGNTTETVSIVFEINGEEVKAVNLTVEANATEMVECVVAEDEAGTYEVTVNGASASFTVTAPPSPTPDVTPTPATPTPTTPVPSEEKFRVGPTVVLRPVVDVIEKGQDGIIELYMDNPALNDVVLHLEAHVMVPAGIQVYSEQYAWATAAGVAYAPTFDIPPGTARTISVHVIADKNARIGSHTLHFSGLYYPGNNKDLYNPLSLTYPIEVKEPSDTKNIPTATSTPAETAAPTKIPGFEGVIAIVGLFAVAYLVERRR